MRMRDLAAALAMTVTCGTALMAGEWVHQYMTTYRRVKQWPYPHVCQDIQAAQAPMALMVDNGWRRENTLGHIMFDEDGSLNSAGTYKIKQIITQSPLSRRSVWVLRADTNDATTARVDKVQQYIAKILPEGNLPPVQVTDRAPASTSGEYLNAIERGIQSSVPPPRLPAMQEESGN